MGQTDRTKATAPAKADLEVINYLKDPDQRF
jgi:hypothetical protein